MATEKGGIWREDIGIDGNPGFIHAGDIMCANCKCNPCKCGGSDQISGDAIGIGGTDQIGGSDEIGTENGL